MTKDTETDEKYIKLIDELDRTLQYLLVLFSLNLEIPLL